MIPTNTSCPQVNAGPKDTHLLLGKKGGEEKRVEEGKGKERNHTVKDFRVSPAEGGGSGQMPDHRQTRHSDRSIPSAASSQLSLQINTMDSSYQQQHTVIWN